MTKEKIVISVDGCAARKLFQMLGEYVGDTPCLKEIKRKTC